VLAQLPDGTFQSCVTSPPYWSLRDYNIPGQIGLEESVFAYIEHLAKVFSQVRRVLKHDGTLWLNIGILILPAAGHGAPATKRTRCGR